MLKMEWRNALKPGILCLALLFPGLIVSLLKLSVADFLNFALVKAFKIVNGPVEQPYLFLLLISFALAILVAANVLGFNAFRREHEDQAFEYLFTFPVSRKRILTIKLIPRLLTLGGLLMIYEAAALLEVLKWRPLQGKLFFLIDPAFFPAVVLTVFFSGFLIGIFEQRDLVSVVTLISFMALFAFPAGAAIVLERIFPDSWSLLYKNGISFVLGALLLLVILSLSALPIFGKMDVRSLPSTSRNFARRALIPLGILCLGAFVLIL